MIKHDSWIPLNNLKNNTAKQRIRRNIFNIKHFYLYSRRNIYPYSYCYIYGNNNYLKFKMGKQDLIHMCGISYRRNKYNKLTLHRFLYDLLHNNVSKKKLYIHKDGTTDLKLSVISAVPLLFNSLKISISAKYQVRYSMTLDGELGTNKDIVGIGLVYGKDGSYHPKTVLNLHDDKKFKGEKVHAILRKKRNDVNNNHIEVVECDNLVHLKDLSYYFMK